MSVETIKNGLSATVAQAPVVAESPGPGSFLVGTQLMQDALPADGVSVSAGPWNTEALFANPFKDAREEALVIDTQNRVTYLQRTDESDTGWRQQPVQGMTGTFAEVVVAVHPNGDVWAFCVPVLARNVSHSWQLLKLVVSANRPDGTAECAWEPQPDALPSPGYGQSLCVSYSPDAGPLIASGGGPGSIGVLLAALTARLPYPDPDAAAEEEATPWISAFSSTPIAEGGRVVGAGFLPYSPALGREKVYVFYVQDGPTLKRHTLSPRGVVATVVCGMAVKQFCGTWNVPNLLQEAPQGDVGFIYLDSGNGDLVTGYCSSAYGSGQPYVDRTSALGFESATSWQDADGKVHIFGLNADGTLQVLHSAGWNSRDIGAGTKPIMPAWTRATPKNVIRAGIGGYDLARVEDRAFAFDFDSTGKLDHFVLYRPREAGAVVWVVKRNDKGAFEKVFDSANEVFGYPLAKGDFMFAFDYAGTGKLDHLVAYRPGAGRVSILARRKLANGNRFDPVYAAATGGIGKYDLARPEDAMFAFDYSGTGKLDHLVAYRPGSRTVWILERTSDPANPYRAIYASHTSGAGDGIGGFDLARPEDAMFAFDYSGTGQADHLLAYRPGAGAVHIVEKQADMTFKSILASSAGIGGYPVRNLNDVLVPFGYGDQAVPANRPDHVLAYQPDTGVAWIMRKQPQADSGSEPTYAPVFKSGDASTNLGDGIGGFTMLGEFTAYDFGRTGRADHLVPYLPGSGRISILEERGGLFLPVYQAPTAPTPVTVGLQAHVAGFCLDPYPDYKPSELVKLDGVSAAEAYCLSTQDVTTAIWATDKVRLPPAIDPGLEMVSHYIANVTLLDTRGAPIPGRPVSVSADSLIEVRVGALSYQVGPGRPIAVTTDAMGRLTVGVDARGLSVSVLYLNTDGLSVGAAVDFAAPVNDYLAGSGTLPSQPGLFTPEALRDAKCTDANGEKQDLVADWDTAPLKPEDAVDHCQRMYAMAAGTVTRLTAMIDGFAEPQPIAGYVIQNWDPSRPSYQIFRTRAELDAYHAYRAAHPAFGGWWEDFTSFASDVWEGIKSGAAAVAEVLVTAVVEIAVWVGNAIVSLGEMIIDAIEQAVQAVEAVFQMIADAITRVIDWLKALFAFADIWNTKKALQAGIDVALDYGGKALDYLGPKAHEWFEKQEAAVIALFDDLKAKYGNTAFGDVQNQAPSAKDPSGASVDQNAMQHNPQANWMLDRVGGQAARHPELFSLTGFPDDSPLPAAIEAFMTKMENSGIGSILEKAKDDILKLIDPADPNGSGSSRLVALFDLLEQVALGLLTVLDTLVQAALVFASIVLAHGNDLLKWSPDLGFINTIYRWIQTSGGIENPEDLTFSGLFCLVAGFFVTTLYKLVMGVNNAPFPDGDFPHIPPPPGHHAYDPAVRVGDDPDLNARLASLQVACGFLGILGGASQAVTDILGVFSQGPGKVAGWWCSGLNLIGTIFFTVISNCPAVGGTEWDAASGEFTAVFGTAVVYLLAQIGAIAANAKYDDADPNLKNKAENAGTVPVSLLSWIMLALMADGCIKTNVNVYSSLQNTIQFVPGSLAWVRLAPKLPYYTARAIVMAVIDTLGNVGPAVMCIVGALNSLPGPQISSANGVGPGGNWLIADGEVGMDYAYKLSVTGADQVWNSPAQNWRWVDGPGASPTPAGLTIDASSGTIGGAPQREGTYGSSTQLGFNVRCSDSFGPPQFSNPAPLAMTVKATPIGGMTITSPPGQQTQDVYVSTTGNPHGPNSPMIVTVTDKSGKPLKGARVQFSFPVAPDQDPIATATFDGNGSSTGSAATDDNGQATVPSFTTSSVQGTYALTASIPGVSDSNAPLSFPLRNVASNVTAITPGTTSTPQSAYGPVGPVPPRTPARPGEVFQYELTATVTDADRAGVPNVIVVFSSPSTTPSPGVFVKNGTTTVRTVTDQNGNVNAGKFTAVKAAYYGDFEITATVPGTQITGRFFLTVKRRSGLGIKDGDADRQPRSGSVV